jgi:hypothetical protein
MRCCFYDALDSIPPGSYNFSVTALMASSRPWENTPFARGTAQVVVPDGSTAQTQITVDEIAMRPVTSQKVSDN